MAEVIRSEAPVVSDALFDGDLMATPERPVELDRFDWIIQDARLVYAPVIAWEWNCPECGAHGQQSLDELLVSSPHGAQHAEDTFDQIMPLSTEAVRRLPAA